MKKFYVFFCICAIVGVAFATDSFLVPVGFPKTFDDLPFLARMNVLSEGYEPFDTIFDADGRCIKNCPYAGMTIAEYEKQLQDTALAVAADLGAGNDNTVTPPPADITPHPSNVSPNPPPTPVPPTNTSKRFACPLNLNPVIITSKFGKRKHGNTTRFHDGLDLGASVGTPVYAVANGVVIINRYDGKGYGWYVVIKHDDKYASLYGHLKEQSTLKKGGRVSRGQKIGISGQTGRTTGPHLHYETRYGNPDDFFNKNVNKPFNPTNYTQCNFKYK